MNDILKKGNILMEEKTILLKSQIFDLQIQYGKIRQEIEIKLKELNELNKEEKNG